MSTYRSRAENHKFSHYQLMLNIKAHYHISSKSTNSPTGGLVWLDEKSVTCETTKVAGGGSCDCIHRFIPQYFLHFKCICYFNQN